MDASMVPGLIAIGSAIAVGLSGIGTGIGTGEATVGACLAMAKNPEITDSIRSTFLIGCGIIGSPSIYGLLVSVTLIFAMFSQI